MQRERIANLNFSTVQSNVLEWKFKKTVNHPQIKALQDYMYETIMK